MSNPRNLADLGRDTNIKDFGETFTLPTSDGTDGQILKTNGSGTLSFTSALTQEQLDTLEILQDDSAYFYTSIGDLYDLSSPKGPNSSIQINDDGIFGGYSSLTYNTTSETLSTNNISLLGDLTVSNDISVSNNISVANNISVLSLDASGDVTVVGDINVGTINTYSIDEIRDRGQLNSSDSAYFYIKLEEIEEKTSGLELLSVETVSTAVSAVDIDLPAGYSRLLIMASSLNFSAAGGTLYYRLSYDGGSTFPTTEGDYTTTYWQFYEDSGNYFSYGSDISQNQGMISYLTDEISGLKLSFKSQLFSDTGLFTIRTEYNRPPVSSTPVHMGHTSSMKPKTGDVADAIRIYPSSGDITAGTFALYGYKETL